MPDAELVARCRAGDAMTGYAEERLAELLGALRPALVADLEQALRAAGVEPRRDVVDHLRRRLDA